MKIRVSPVRRLAGRVTVPGDKSISHRAALFGAHLRTMRSAMLATVHAQIDAAIDDEAMRPSHARSHASAVSTSASPAAGTSRKAARASSHARVRTSFWSACDEARSQSSRAPSSRH